MGKLPNQQAVATLPKAKPSLLSQVTLHFEYDKTISQARADLKAGK